SPCSASSSAPPSMPGAAPGTSIPATPSDAPAGSGLLRTATGGESALATVETVNGPLDLEELGLTLIHEHFRTTDEATRFQFPHLYDEAPEWAAAMSDANAIRGHGVQTVVEPSAMFLHRDAAFSKRVADASGLNVILATGVYTYEHLPQPLLNRTEDQLAELFVHDIERGIQGTGIK